MISGDTTVGRLLEDHPELVDVLARYHPHFGQLRNRLLRKVMAPLVTVDQAARIAGVPAHELLTVLRQALGESAAGEPPAERAARPDEAPVRSERAEGGVKPGALQAIPESRLAHLDVRGVIAQGEEPFARIMRAVNALRPDQALVLRAPFEPIPLYRVLGKRGLVAWTECRGEKDWVVWFYRDQAVSAASLPTHPDAPQPDIAMAEPTAIQIDVRGLEPPRPMVCVLEALETLGPASSWRSSTIAAPCSSTHNSTSAASCTRRRIWRQAWYGSGSGGEAHRDEAGSR
jgi:Uncharacterized conserved protein (DUF2249)/Domain of unknown function (DUF1858)